jgi:hypothetical protein
MTSKIVKICPYMSRPHGSFSFQERLGETLSWKLMEVPCLGKECAASYKNEFDIDDKKHIWVCSIFDTIVECEEIEEF